MEPRRFVYILRSDTDPDRHYVGLTSDVAERLHWHERYLKTGSGRAFAKRHFGDEARKKGISSPHHAIEIGRKTQLSPSQRVAWFDASCSRRAPS
jgi:hypothetical protein